MPVAGIIKTKIEMKDLEIKNFDLSYDGMYFISWENKKIRVYLELNTILKMLEIEGLSYKDVNQKLKTWEPLHFNKVKMVVFVFEEDNKTFYRTSEFSDEYLDVDDITMIEIELKTNHD